MEIAAHVEQAKSNTMTLAFTSSPDCREEARCVNFSNTRPHSLGSKSDAISHVPVRNAIASCVEGRDSCRAGISYRNGLVLTVKAFVLIGNGLAVEHLLPTQPLLEKRRVRFPKNWDFMIRHWTTCTIVSNLSLLPLRLAFGKRL